MGKFTPTPLKEIKSKVLAYHQKMNAIAKFLRENNAPEEIQIDQSNEFLEFYIDKAALIRLNSIALLPNFDSFSVYLGLEDYDNGTSVTGCFLGIDKKKNILPQHKEIVRGFTAIIDGEDTWLPPGGQKVRSKKDFTLKSSIDNIEEHFNK